MAEIDDKVNTSILIMNMQCDDSYMLVSFQEIGYYDESGKMEEYGNFGCLFSKILYVSKIPYIYPKPASFYNEFIKSIQQKLSCCMEKE